MVATPAPLTARPSYSSGTTAILWPKRRAALSLNLAAADVLEAHGNTLSRMTEDFACYSKPL